MTLKKSFRHEKVVSRKPFLLLAKAATANTKINKKHNGLSVTAGTRHTRKNSQQEVDYNLSNVSTAKITIVITII